MMDSSAEYLCNNGNNHALAVRILTAVHAATAKREAVSKAKQALHATAAKKQQQLPTTLWQLLPLNKCVSKLV